MIPILKPLQIDHVRRIREARQAGHRIIVVQAATGFGKNTEAAYIVSQAALKAQDVLLMVHRRKLVDQISDRLHQFQVTHGVLMRGQEQDRSCKIQVASRDTLLSRCVRNEWLGLPPANLVIVDEAHHAGDPNSEYRKILAQYPQATILLLTATPVWGEGQGLGPWAQALVCAAPTSQLIKEGYLLPLKCYAPERKHKGKRYVRGIAGDLVESWKQYGENRPSILFCARVQHSQDAVAAFAAAGIKFAHMDANTPDEERDEIFDKVANGKLQGISNVGIVGEGVDVPELGCCQLFCEVGSRTKLLQSVGRVMRTSPGKEYGIAIDHSGAVFKHGFPDEDTEWLLNGNADEKFAKKHKDGLTEKAFYCKRCELAYHGSETCPQCGRLPVKPPRSVFAPPPVDISNELLTEADRSQHLDGSSRDEQIQHWFRCLHVAKKRNGTFKMASIIFKQKYGFFPPDDFPMMPKWSERHRKITEVYPEFGRKKAQ